MNLCMNAELGRENFTRILGLQEASGRTVPLLLSEAAEVDQAGLGCRLLKAQATEAGPSG